MKPFLRGDLREMERRMDDEVGPANNRQANYSCVSWPRVGRAC